jgi:hypothetical protein
MQVSSEGVNLAVKKAPGKLSESAGTITISANPLTEFAIYVARYSSETDRGKKGSA